MEVKLIDLSHIGLYLVSKVGGFIHR